MNTNASRAALAHYNQTGDIDGALALLSELRLKNHVVEDDDISGWMTTGLEVRELIEDESDDIMGEVPHDDGELEEAYEPVVCHWYVEDIGEGCERTLPWYAE